MVKLISGRFGTDAQSRSRIHEYLNFLKIFKIIPMTYSPPTIGVPPRALFIAVTSSTGPAIREVPVSAMA